MKTTLTLLLACLLLGSAPLRAAEEFRPIKLQSLRGDTPVDKTNEAEMFKQEKDRAPMPRDFVQQPPLIPHSIRGYNITANFNKCMDCHAWSKARQANATKVSLTHFKDRDGKELANISPRRYFCTQCHVPQTDAKPLVGNTFEKAETLKPQ